MSRALPLLVLVLLCGCGFNDPKPAKRSLGTRYHHTFDFLWDEVKDVLGRGWEIAEEDREQRTIRTEWIEDLAPMNTWGRRHRLRIVVEGSEGEGFTVMAEQESQENTNDKNPLSSEDADWDDTQTDGARADRFVMALERRLRPRRTWRQDDLR